MPSSTAYLERKGGASAVAVAASSETTESAVRRRYGLVSRASVSSRRRVRAHDQSSTCAPRCWVRWLPGCQTLTRWLFLIDARAFPHPGWVGARLPRRRRYHAGAHASVPVPSQNGASGDLLHRGACLDGVGEAALEEAVLVDVAVDRARLEQLLVRPAGDDAPLVEDEDPRVDGESARDRQPLPLAAGQRDAALADHGVVPLRQPLYELVRLRQARHALELLVVQVADAEGDVLAHRRGEEERILGDDSD